MLFRSNETASLTFVRDLNMQGSGSRWTCTVGVPFGYLPRLLVFINGIQVSVSSTTPAATQYQQTQADGVLTLRLGISLTSGDSLRVVTIGLDRDTTARPSLPVYGDTQNELLVLMNEQIDLEEAKMCLNRRLI